MSKEIKQYNQIEKNSEILDLLKKFESDKLKVIEMAKFQSNQDETLNFFIKGNNSQRSFVHEMFRLDGALKALNAHYWDLLMKKTDLLEVMDAKNRTTWQDQIELMKTPDFTPENVKETMTSLLLNRENFFVDKVCGLFQALSPDHKTNKTKGFSDKLIIDYLVDSKFMSPNHRRCEILNDLRAVISKVINRDMPNPTSYHDLYKICKDKKFGESIVFDGGTFSLKLFKKGTAHILISEDVAEKLNLILAKKFPLSIPAKENVPNKKKKTYEKSYNLFSYKICQNLMSIGDSISKGYSFSIENFENKEEIRKILEHFMIEPIKKDLYKTDRTELSEAFYETARIGKLEDRESSQFFETPPEIAQDMVDLLEIDDNSQILEPSAGTGGIARFLPPNQTTLIEQDESHCRVLKKLNAKEVICGDYLEINISPLIDRIILNPPYSKNRAKIHLQKAINDLQSGIIVALVPASLKNFKFSENQEVSEVLVDKFKNASVNTVIIKIRK